VPKSCLLLGVPWWGRCAVFHLDYGQCNLIRHRHWASISGPSALPCHVHIFLSPVQWELPGNVGIFGSPLRCAYWAWILGFDRSHLIHLAKPMILRDLRPMMLALSRECYHNTIWQVLSTDFFLWKMDGDRRSVREVPQSVCLSAGRNSTFWRLFLPANMEIASGIRNFSPDWLLDCN